MQLHKLLLGTLLLSINACASYPPIQASAKSASQERGLASYYGKRFHGRTTANGEKFNQYALTAAHKTLPFGTKVKVRNKKNGQSVVVRINDRGPFVRGRIIDLSYKAAKSIGMIRMGVAPVVISVLN